MTEPNKLRAQQKEKNDYIDAQVKLAGQFAQLADGINRSLTLYQNLDYANEITNEDLVNYRFSKAQLDAFVAMMLAIATLVEAENYRAVNDRIRDITVTL